MAVIPWRLCSPLLFVLVFVSAEEKNLLALLGQNVTLPGQAPNNNILIVEWSRADLGGENVLFYRDDRIEEDNQHPSFKDRVDLQDRQMKDGDVSLVLKNVTFNDTGTYKCRVFIKGTRLWKSICTITLSVAPPPPGPGGAPVGLIVGLIVSALLLLLVAAAVGFWIHRNRKEPKQDPYPLAAEPQPV